MQTPNTHSQLQQSGTNFNQPSNSAKRKVLPATTAFNGDPRMTQPTNILNTQSQKAINLQRLGMPSSALDTDFVSSKQL